MKPAPFAYFDPRTLPEALDRLAEHGDDAKILAGGQSLVPMLNLRLARPAAIVDINRVAGLDGLSVERGELRLGALVRQQTLERWAHAHLPLVAAALRLVGHRAIRARGTVAGSIAHADPASELPALLLCLDGAVVARSRTRERTIAAGDFFQGPLATALEADEIATETRWALPAAGTGWGFHEIARRHGDFALAGVATCVRLTGHRVDGARVALFGVGPTAVRSRSAEARMEGRSGAASDIAEAAAAGAADLRPDSDLHASGDYRRRVARTLIARALTDAVARARAESPAPAEQRGFAAMRSAGGLGGPSRAPQAEQSTSRTIRVRVNGQLHERTVEARKTLVDFLREDLGLTGTHVGCEHGVCGACTVLHGDDPVRSCLLLAVQMDGEAFATVEGLADGERLHPLQQAFWDHHGLQCGFCTPGMLLTAKAFLAENPRPTDEEIREAISGNLCRCTGYHFIVDAIRAAAERMA